MDIHEFQFDYLTHDTVPLLLLETYLKDLIEKEQDVTLRDELFIHIKRVRFYIKLQKFGYHLVLKPVKTYYDEEGSKRRKANCDVDMSFCMMRNQEVYQRAVVLSGDGAFFRSLSICEMKGKRCFCWQEVTGRPEK